MVFFSDEFYVHLFRLQIVPATFMAYAVCGL